MLLKHPLKAKQQVDVANLHERLICVVRIIGAGTYDDPKRPMFAPAGNLELKRTSHFLFPLL